MRKGLVAALVALAVAVYGSGVAGAEEVAPGGGNTFGAHVTVMAPEHPQDHGAMFGECVSAMATDATCPHHP